MAKALLQREVQKAIAEQTARRVAEEKPVASTNTLATPRVAPKAAPLPVQSSVPSPAPAYIQQVIVYTPPDNSAIEKERAEKEKAAALYHLEKTAREKSHQHHQEELERVKQATKEQLEAEQRERIKAEELQREELERNQQLVKEDNSLKRRHDIDLERSKVDEETIQRITEENEALKRELEKARNALEETKLPNTLAKDEENKVENIAVPPPYDEGNPIVAESNDTPVNPISEDVAVIGNEADPDTSSNCSVS